MRRGPSYRFAVAVVRPPARALMRREWRGAEHLPREGGVVVVANHTSFLDAFFVADFLDANGRLPRFLAKAELFRVPVMGAILRDAGQIPVRRRSTDASRAYDEAVAAVRRGECVVVYPEGTLTRDLDLWPMAGRTGAVRIALRTGCPVVPLAHWGVEAVMPPRAKRFYPFPRRTVQVLLGTPVDLSAFEGSEPTADLLRAATEHVMDAVSALVADLRGESPPARRPDATTMGPDAGSARTGDTDERRPGPMDSAPDPTRDEP